MLNCSEFEKMLKKLGINCNKNYLEQAFIKFDTNNDK